MKKTALILMVLTICSKLLGFTREIILSYFYGASGISDAYLISLTIPSIIFGFIGVGISTAYIPLYSKVENIYGMDEGKRYTNNLINILLIVCTIIVTCGLLFTSNIVRIFASGFEGDILVLTIKFTRISLIGIYFTAILSIAKPFLQLNGNYTVPALIGLPLSIITIVSIVISSKTDLIILSIGSMVAIIFQLLLLIPFMYKAGYRYKFTINIKDKNIREMALISLPVIMGTSVNQVNKLIDRTLASQIVVGGISALNYSNRLYAFVQDMFVLSIATVLYPTISKMASEGNMDEFKKSVSEAIGCINVLVVPATIGSIVFSRQIVSLLFGRGAFNTNALELTSGALLFYSIGMIGFGLREILSKAFYSIQDTKTPMINATIGVSLNIILNIILSKYLGIGGLALATSISAIITTVLLFVSLRKKIGPFGMKQISISFLKILFASLVMGAIAKISFNYLTANIFSQNLSLIASIGIGALTYFAVIYFMKIDDVDVIVNAIKKKLTRSKVVV